MYFKYKHNMFYRPLPPHRDGTSLEVAPEVFAPWMGILDRNAARIITNAKQVGLTFEGWRLRETDSWQWIDNPELVFVGCWVPDLGVWAVTDYSRPLLKRR